MKFSLKLKQEKNLKKRPALIQESEIDLLSRLQEGDKAAETELIQKFLQPVLLMVKSRLGSHQDDVEDLVQDIMCAVVDSFRKGKFDLKKGTSIEGYVIGISKNHIMNYRKRKDKDMKLVRNSNLLSDLVDEEWHRVHDHIEDDELKRDLRRAISKLKIKYQEVLDLFYFERKSLKDIAAMLSCSVQKVENCLAYARQKLKDECEKSNIFSIFFEVLLIH